MSKGEISCDAAVRIANQRLFRAVNTARGAFDAPLNFEDAWEVYGKAAATAWRIWNASVMAAQYMSRDDDIASR
jgi:hypothetical protein